MDVNPFNVRAHLIYSLTIPEAYLYQCGVAAAENSGKIKLFICIIRYTVELGIIIKCMLLELGDPPASEHKAFYCPMKYLFHTFS